MIVHGNLWHAPAFATEAALNAHIATTAAGTHGSAVAATADRIIHRDAAGRAQIANPAANPDIDNLGSRAAADAAEAAARAAADAAHAALTIVGTHGSAVLATPNTLVHRDAAGRSQIVNPVANPDIDNLGSRNAAIAAHATLTTGVHGLGVWGFTDTTLAAVTLYVDIATGNDGNPGTSALPKQTILGALNALPVVIAHPVTICVRPGNYPENNIAIDFARFATLNGILIKVVNANDEDMFYNGLATGGGINFLDDAGAAWSINRFQNAYIWIYGGTGAGQVRQIASNTATRITVTVNWAVNPNATSYYAIGGGATLTGTGACHISSQGKMVNLYGFRHTGASSDDARWSIWASGAFYYNYCATSVIGLLVGYFSSVAALYNYYASTSQGVQAAYFSFCVPRASVFNGCVTGCYFLDKSMASMHSSALFRNHFLNCTIGIRIGSDAGCVGASTQTFIGCTTNIDPAISTTVPQWWT